jgi:hypothetical protein
MKKLLLLCIMFLSLNAFTQEDETFTRNYANVVVKMDNKEESRYKNSIVAVFADNQVKIYFNGKVDVYYQVTDVEKGVSEGGQPYQLINCITKDGGKNVTIQLFDDYDSLRIIYRDGYVEFYN